MLKRRRNCSSSTCLPCCMIAFWLVFLVLFHSNHVVHSEIKSSPRAAQQHHRFSHALDGINLLGSSSKNFVDSFMTLAQRHDDFNERMVLVDVYIKQQVILTSYHLNEFKKEFNHVLNDASGGREEHHVPPTWNVVAGSDNRIFRSWISWKQLSEISKKRNLQYMERMEELNAWLGEEFLTLLFESHEQVELVSREFQQTLLTLGSNDVVQTNTLTNDPRYLWNQGVTGKDQIVHLIDSGLDVNHCYFSKKGGVEDYFTVPNVNNRKVVFYERAKISGDREDKNGHGSHTAGIIAGNPEVGATSSDSPILQDIGIAKDAKIYMTDAAVSALFYVDNITLYLNNAFKVGSRISSNSWGNVNNFDCIFDCICFESNSNRTKPVTNEYCLKQFGKLCCQIGNDYDINSERVDEFLNKNDEMIVIFAAGNNGNYGKEGSILSPAAAKNTLAVGACYSSLREYSRYTPNVNISIYNHENLGYFSARGPTFDNRIKPEVVAPGVAIWSARTRNPFCDTTALIQKTGTSMAAPSVAGSAALIRDYLLQNNKKRLLQYELINKAPSQTLSGTLVKAILIHSASVMNGSVKLDGDFSNDEHYVALSQQVYPNKYVGYGRVNLGNLLNFDEVGRNSLFLVNRFELDTSQKLSLKFRVKSLPTAAPLSNAGLIKATLTWYDLKGTLTSPTQSSIKQLINDLNLSMELREHDQANITVKCVGNGKCVTSLSSDTFLNDDLVFDSVNNVERIEMVPNTNDLDLKLNSILTIVIEASPKNVGAQNLSFILSTSHAETELEFIGFSVSDASLPLSSYMLLILLLSTWLMI
ncbi:hypothetical protein C9374_011857 [Naegleria lovaniensis]|uniref:Peptidase S8/S53 domain-containing protein n=1 Tax=Naegleria lovaniensis TaxID=51637 RepID=A0AA88GF76_NAELO|nr:uncharacterized protein C9374_011857 [Naegleria lovaniensis]KAG2373768.1 hypothetical protein C9374_011857 [Naegleria lovaniensis]